MKKRYILSAFLFNNGEYQTRGAYSNNLKEIEKKAHQFKKDDLIVSINIYDMKKNILIYDFTNIQSITTN